MSTDVIPEEKFAAMRDYALKLRKKFPKMKPKRLANKVAAEFHIKIIYDSPTDTEGRAEGDAGVEHHKQGNRFG